MTSFRKDTLAFASFFRVLAPFSLQRISRRLSKAMSSTYKVHQAKGTSRRDAWRPSPSRSASLAPSFHSACTMLRSSASGRLARAFRHAQSAPSLSASLPTVSSPLPNLITSASSTTSSRRTLTTSRPSQHQKSTNTISASEISHFSALSAHWWDPTGEFGLLHRMNPARIEVLRDEILRVEEVDVESGRWLEGRSGLDVGCGGGIFAEVRLQVSRKEGRMLMSSCA